MRSDPVGEGSRTTPSLEIVVRTLRHEVGDLLQSVYSAVAILQDRLPPGQTLERTILTDLRRRAETCKHELDATHDLICPVKLNADWMELSELASNIAATFSARHPGSQVECDSSRLVTIWGDAQRLSQMGTMLLTSLCQAARSKVKMQVALDAKEACAAWRFHHDGPQATDEQLSWLSEAFSTTRQARFGLGLALARRIVELHGGRVTMDENAEEGFLLALRLPLQAPRTTS
jgi:signal transduction histidine kinase